MVPRPAHIQGQLRQGIKPFDLRWKKAVDGAESVFATLMGFYFPLSGWCGEAAKASRTIVCASSRMAAQTIRSPEALRMQKGLFS